MVKIVNNDDDPHVTRSELDLSNELLELELREEKADSQRRMAWIAILSMIIFTIALFSPIVTESRVAALADLLGLFYIAQAGIVGAYMGVSAWMSKSSDSISTTRFTNRSGRRIPSDSDN